VYNADSKVALVGSWRVSIILMDMAQQFSFLENNLYLMCFPVLFGSRLVQGMYFLMRSSKLLTESI
jgi:hypothetical protein